MGGKVRKETHLDQTFDFCLLESFLFVPTEEIKLDVNASFVLSFFTGPW